MPFHPLQLKDAFSLLYAEKYRLQVILFSGLYCFIFLLIFSPHNMSTWYESDTFGSTGVLLVFSCSAILALAVSRYLLDVLFKDRNLANGQYFLWFTGEVFLVTAFVNMSNLLMHKYLHFSIGEFTDTLKYVFLLLVQTYGISLLWLYTREKSQELENLEKSIRSAPVKKGMLSLKDEQGKAVMTIDPDNLLLIKAEDNYVQVFYTTGNDLKKLLIRNSIKNLAVQLEGLGFVRTHRSYVVNAAKVILFKKNSRGYYTFLAGLDKMEVPVSASYLQAFSNLVTITN